MLGLCRRSSSRLLFRSLGGVSSLHGVFMSISGENQPLGCLILKKSMYTVPCSAFNGGVGVRRIKDTIFQHYFNRQSFTSLPIDAQAALELCVSSVEDEKLTAKEKYAIYLKKLCDAGNLSAAFYILEHLQDRSVNICLKTYNMLLAKASEVNNFMIFSDIFKRLLLSNIPPDSSSYKIVANCFQKVSNVEFLRFIREVSEITGDNNPAVMNRIIFVTAKYGQLDKAIMIYEELKKLACQLDIVTFNTVLAILGKAGKVQKMLYEFSSMKDLGHTPDIVTYNTLINCLKWAGELHLCNQVVREMADRGIEFDLRTYTALIDGLGRAGHVQDALRLFDEMKTFQLPSIYVYRSLVSNLNKAGKCEEASDLLEEMKANSSKLLGPEDFKKEKREESGSIVTKELI